MHAGTTYFVRGSFQRLLFKFTDHVERKLLQFNCQVYADGVNVLRQNQRDGGKIQNSLNARIDERIGNSLGDRGGDGDNGHADVFLLDDLLGFIQVIDLQPFDVIADLRGISIKPSHDFETLLMKPAIANQRAAQVTHADDGQVPRLIGA